MEGANVKCEICDQEFANSEEMKAHMERDHTVEERGGEGELEKPDMMREQEERAPIVPGKNN
jgi:hypothetical protein